MSDHDHTSTEEHREGYDFAHPMPVPMLLTIFGILIFLTIVTVAQASFNLGAFEIPLVMGIATIKAILVALFFMHLLYDKPFNLAIFMASFLFVGLFVSLTLTDSLLTSPDFIPVDDAAVTAPAE